MSHDASNCFCMFLLALKDRIGGLSDADTVML